MGKRSKSSTGLDRWDRGVVVGAVLFVVVRALVVGGVLQPMVSDVLAIVTCSTILFQFCRDIFHSGSKMQKHSSSSSSKKSKKKNKAHKSKKHSSTRASSSDESESFNSQEEDFVEEFQDVGEQLKEEEEGEPEVEPIVDEPPRVQASEEEDDKKELEKVEDESNHKQRRHSSKRLSVRSSKDSSLASIKEQEREKDDEKKSKRNSTRSTKSKNEKEDQEEDEADSKEKKSSSKRAGTKEVEIGGQKMKIAIADIDRFRRYFKEEPENIDEGESEEEVQKRKSSARKVAEKWGKRVPSDDVVNELQLEISKSRKSKRK